jgi:hypothetical protein
MFKDACVAADYTRAADCRCLAKHAMTKLDLAAESSRTGDILRSYPPKSKTVELSNHLI